MISLTTTDILVLAAYLLAIAAFGSSFYRRKTTASEYFLGGKSMGWLPIGISIVAADLSAITVMGTPAWSFKHNLTLLWATIGYPVVAPLVVFVFAPFYSRLNLFTAYEYLERRFDLRVRLSASFLFQMLRSWHVAIAIYGPALVIHMVSRLSIVQCVLIMGLFTTIYTTLGGMKAVIWTDVIQFTTVLSGAALIAFTAIHQIHGGLATVYAIASQAGHTRFIDTSFNLADTTSIWACLIGGSFLALGPLTTDQAVLQRLFTAKSSKDFQQSIALQAILIVPVCAVLFGIGLVLFAFYHIHPDRLTGLRNTDAIVPYFALTELPRGVAGLVIAAIFAASMAVMSAGINALTTAFSVDVYARIIRPGQSAEHYASAGRWGTGVWGCVVTLLALFAGHMGDLAIAYPKVSSIIVGPMLGIFLLGILTRRANGAGTLIGALAGCLITVTVNLATAYSFYYMGAIGTVATFICGYAASLLSPPVSGDKLENLVLHTNVQNIPKTVNSGR